MQSGSVDETSKTSISLKNLILCLGPVCGCPITVLTVPFIPLEFKFKVNLALKTNKKNSR